MKNAALYTRESPSLRENELTIESQTDALKQKIKENQDILVQEFRDNGWAGDLLARPALDELRDFAKQGKFEKLYIFDRSRLARKYWLQELIIDELESQSIEILFLQEPKVENDEDRVLQGMKGLFAEYERVKTTERTRRGRLHRARKGLVVGHEALYGYKYMRPNHDEENRWFEVDEKEAKVVRLIFKWLAYEGLTLRGLIKRLYEKKIPSKNGNPIWASSTLSRLIRCEAYVGNFHYNKTISLIPKNPIKTVENGEYKRMKKTSRKMKPREDWIPIKISPIIDKTTFDLAQEQLKRNLSMAHRELKYQYFLRGLIKCDCGCSFAGDGAYRGTLYYRCTNRLKKFPEKKTCSARIINAGKIETKVWGKILNLFTNKEILANLVSKYFESQSQNRISQIQEKEIDKELKLLKTEEEKWLDAFDKSVINLEQLDVRLKSIKIKEGSLNSEKTRVREQEAMQIESPSEEYINTYCEELLEELPLMEDKDKEFFLHKVIKEILIQDKTAIVRGIIPITNPATKNDASQGQFSSSGRIGRSPDNSGGGRKWAKPPILYNCRTPG